MISFANDNKNVSQSPPGEFAAVKHFPFAHVVDDDLLDCEDFTGEVRNPLLNLFPLFQFLLNQSPFPSDFLQSSCVRFVPFCLLFFRAFILILIRSIFVYFLFLFGFGLLFGFADDFLFGHVEEIFDVSLLASQLFESFSNESLDDSEDFLVHDSDVVEVIKLVVELFLELVVGVGSGGQGCFFVTFGLH